MIEVSTRLTPFEQLVTPKLNNGQLADFQQQRLVNFLQFDNPPLPTDSISTIICLGTEYSSEEFSMRMMLTDYYARQYPNATMLLTGKNSPGSSQEETEAYLMEQTLIAMGIAKERLIKEEESTNTRENIINSFALLSSKQQNILFISSGYHTRRIDLYAKKVLDASCRDNITYFLIDYDVEANKDERIQCTHIHQLRRHMFTHHEWQRLPEYRRRRHL